MVSMNKLSSAERARIISCLVEDNSIRSTVRMTGFAKNTVTKLLVDLGGACSVYQDEVMRNLPLTKIQCDEIWSFCYAEQKNVSPEHEGQFGYGDVWTWTAIDADTKLVPCFMIGRRDGETATTFIEDLASRLANRVQLTTDGHKPYLKAVAGAFGHDIDYAMLIKIYGADPNAERRYSPPVCIGAEARAIIGDPDPRYISTSYVERQNLTMEMGMRRFTRLANAFSKKVENLGHAVALHFMWYNFGRIHQTLKTTPAMAAGIADHRWTTEDIAALLDRDSS
jgi:IS1 family transposase